MNADAFESYGLDASLNGPTCQECSDRFMKAVNELMRGDGTHLTFRSGVSFIFWTREDIGFSPLMFLKQPDESEVCELLRSAFTGDESQVDEIGFYAAAFAASGGRASIRDWIDTTVGRAKAQLARFFALQRVVGEWGDAGRPLGVYSLATATARAGADPPAYVLAALLHSALAGGPPPASLLYRAVERCRIEGTVPRPRAALIKMVIQSRRHDPSSQEEETMVELDSQNHQPAYLCGRLFAALEAVQRAALGAVGATIVDRFYGTASSAPATVFGRLIRGAQPHLATLRRDKPRAYAALDRRLQDIQEGLAAYPTTLSLEQQGLFALGYYHQRAADRHAATEARRRGEPIDLEPDAEQAEKELKA